MPLLLIRIPALKMSKDNNQSIGYIAKDLNEVKKLSTQQLPIYRTKIQRIY